VIVKVTTIILFYATFLTVNTEEAFGKQSIPEILSLIKSENNSILAARQALEASNFAKKGTGYIPDPFFKVNIFGSPIETRNGPQKSNVMLTQPIPWPSALRAEIDLATSKESLKREQLEILLLDLEYYAKSMIFKHVELTEKLKNKTRMVNTLNNLSKVVLGRLELGTASQSEISRINIEIATILQKIREIKAKNIEVENILKTLSGGKDVSALLPEKFEVQWGRLGQKSLQDLNIKSHPLIRLANAKVNTARAVIAQARAKRLPKIGASVSWFRIDKPQSIMGATDAGKDAWAVGASVSLPLWQGKYDSMENSSIAKLSESELELAQKQIELTEGINSIFENFKSVRDITTMYLNDILPQAIQTLKSESDSYSQGKSTFEKVIESYLRIVKFEDQLIENQVKQATLKAALEKMSGQSL